MKIYRGEGKIAFQGNHCIVGLSIVQEVGKIAKADVISEWHKVGNCSNSATDKEKIANFICDLPSLTEEITHPDQLSDWVAWKDWSIDVARCFLSGHTQPDNPLLRSVEDGLIDQWSHDYTWLVSDLYDNLWKLVNLRGRQIKSAIKKVFGDYPFASNRELLQEIIRADIEGEFCQILKKQYQYKPTHIKEIHKLKRKMHREGLVDKSLEQLYKLIEQHAPYPIWYDRLISVCEVMADRGDTFINTRLQINADLLDGISRMRLKADCDPSLSHHRRRKELWINGKKNPGQPSDWMLNKS